MSQIDRSKDWLAQAENDLLWGRSSCENGFYAQSCFVAQQTAEKALNALAYSRDFDLVKSHSVKIICQQLGLNGDILEAASVLDQYYIGARYPDGLPAGAPFQMFTKKQAKEALELSEKVIKKVKNEIKK